MTSNDDDDIDRYDVEYFICHYCSERVWLRGADDDYPTYPYCCTRCAAMADADNLDDTRKDD